MFYDRKVKYFDYIKDGERIHGAGFAKLEVRDNICSIQLQISGLHITDTFTKQVYLLSRNKEEVFCQIELQGGRGNVAMKLPANYLCNGLAYEQLQAIRIPLGTGRELYCRIAETEKVLESVQEKETISVQKVMYEPEIISEEASVSLEEKQEPPEQEPAEQPAQMLANKWEQICAIYPHIKPFQDDRDYLRVGPEDFVILHQKYYQLVHNSFLLHGYYNYQHLILTRQEWRGEMRYYIGVPGNFYEREKQVAMMFGFESFECKEEPAGMGEYGYYMIRVEL